MATFARSMSQLHSTGCCQHQGAWERAALQRQRRRAVEAMLSTKGSHYGLVNPPPASRLPGVSGLPNAEYLRCAQSSAQRSLGVASSAHLLTSAARQPKAACAPKHAHGNVEEGCDGHRHADRLAHRLVLWVLHGVLRAQPRTLTRAHAMSTRHAALFQPELLSSNHSLNQLPCLAHSLSSFMGKTSLRAHRHFQQDVRVAVRKRNGAQRHSDVPALVGRSRVAIHHRDAIRRPRAVPIPHLCAHAAPSASACHSRTHGNAEGRLSDDIADRVTTSGHMSLSATHRLFQQLTAPGR